MTFSNYKYYTNRQELIEDTKGFILGGEIRVLTSGSTIHYKSFYNDFRGAPWYFTITLPKSFPAMFREDKPCSKNISIPYWITKENVNDRIRHYKRVKSLIETSDGFLSSMITDLTNFKSLCD